MSHTECHVAFCGTSWGKDEDAMQAIRIAFKHENLQPNRAYKLNIMRLVFPEPIENLDRVTVDGLGTVSFPIGTKVTKWEGMPVPPAVVQAYSAFDLEMEEWQETDLEKVCYPDD